MTAHDAMNGVQFMSVHDVGKMRSSDFPGMTMAQTYQIPRGARQLYYSSRNPVMDAGTLPSPDNTQVRYSTSGKTVYHPPGSQGLTNKMKKQRTLDFDVAANGVKEPVQTSRWDEEDGGDILTNGHHRYWAARDAGHATMPVQLVDWRRNPV